MACFDLPLHGIQSRKILAQEKPPGGNHRPGKARHPLKPLTEVQPGGGVLRGAEHGDVRVCCHLQAGEAASDDERAAHEAGVLLEFCGRPEEDGTCTSFF